MILAMLFPMVFAVAIAAQAAETISPPRPGPRVLVENGSYRLARFEPAAGCYLGGYVLQDSVIGGDMGRFEELTGRKHASYFKYVGYGRPFPQEWFDRMKAAGAAPHLAWEPNQGLDAIHDDGYLRQFARQMGAASVPVFLRFASEVNGTWMPYHGDPAKFREKWKLVHDVMAQEAPNVMMVWTVFTFPEKTILPYYPGDDVVDWVGVNIYSVIYHNNKKSDRADNEDPLRLLDYVYEKFSDRKPIQISEFGATHFTATDGKSYPDFAKTKIRRLYQGLAAAYPRVKSIFYFDVNNLVDGLKGRQINNYAVTDDPSILAVYRDVVAGPHFLSRLEANREGQLNSEFFLTRKPVIVEKNVQDCLASGELWVAAADLQGLPGWRVEAPTKAANAEKSFGRGGRAIPANVAMCGSGNDTVKISLGTASLSLPISDQPRRVHALRRKGQLWFPLRELANTLGLRLEVDPAYEQIKVSRIPW